MAQGFPFTSVDAPIVGLDERFQVEGEPYSLFQNNVTGTAVATGNGDTQIAVTSSAPNIGRAFYCERIEARLDTAGLATVGAALVAGSLFQAAFEQHLVDAYRPVSVPVKRFFRPIEVLNGSVRLAIRNNLTGGSVTYKGSISAIGHVLTDDFNFHAAYAIHVAGDSINAPSTAGPSKTAALYMFRVRDWLIQQGFDTRVVLKAKPGSSTADHETWRQDGWHRICSRPSLGFYALGTNDAIQGLNPTTVSAANLASYWLWWKFTYPGVPLVVLTPPPLNSVTPESNAVGIRAALIAYVAAQANPLLKSIDLGSAWTATDATKYADVTTHPNDAGHVILAGIITAVLASMGILPVG